MNNSRAHKKLVDDILVTFGGLPYVRLWQNKTGVARSFSDVDAVIQYGLKGSTDIIGIAKSGRFIAIEVKTGTGKLSKEQENFRAMIERFGALYVEARSLEDVQLAFRALQ